MSEPNFLRTYAQRRGANVGPSKTCCYVAGEAPYGNNPFCGQKSVPGYSYCEHHKSICLVEPDADKTRNQIRGALKILAGE